jgi:hypothetical protein
MLTAAGGSTQQVLPLLLATLPGVRPAKWPVKLFQCLPRLRGMEAQWKRESKAKFAFGFPVKQLKIS